MRAEVKTGIVNFRLSELDRETGARLDTVRGEFAYNTVNGFDYLNTLKIEGAQITWAEVEGMLDFRTGSEASDYTAISLYVYDQNGRYVTKLTKGVDKLNQSNVEIRDGYTIEIVLTVDRQTAGELYDPNKANNDGIDDREQAVVTVLMQHSVGSSVYDRPTDKEMYVVNKGDNVAKLVEDGDYYNFPGWDEYYYDSDTDKEYVRVYSDSLAKVTGDIEVKADWAEDKAGLDRFAPAATNDKDTNGDGKVSCDEYYGTTGLEWSDKLNACVVSSTGDAVVTIPNTATK